MLPSLRRDHYLRASVVIIGFEGNRIVMARDDVMAVIVVDAVTRHHSHSGTVVAVGCDRLNGQVNLGLDSDLYS